MAQQVEHILGKDEVVGSNPISSSKKRRTSFEVRRFFIFMIHFLIHTKKKTAT